MCGIIGYVGKKNAAEIVYDGLKQLEYRGYDSAGAAIMDGAGKINIVKRQGRVEALAPKLKDIAGSVGIGHTRWATHGKPSDINAHPHSYGKISIVHNGIIENYAALRAQMEDSGERFFSETDSEVIAHLINKFYDGDLLKAVETCVKLLKGSYALMAMCEGVRTIVIAKNRSQAILGFGEGEYFCASDEPALAGKCKNICVLEDGDLAVISDGGISIFDENSKPVTRKILPNTAAAADLDLHGCPHYMLKELREVPASIKNTCASFCEVEQSLKDMLSGVKRVVLLGCGTAYHAGLVGKRYFESFARLPAECENAGEFRYKNPVIDSGTAVFAVSQSGETADTLEASRLALSLGAKVVAVTNCPHSALARVACLTVPVAAGCEICVAATKSYTGQIAALYLSALALSEKNINGAKMLAEGARLSRQVIQNTNVGALVNMCKCASGVYFLGRDIDYAVALEGSLKLKEVSYVPGEGYPAGELKHGTLALIDGNTVSVVLITDTKLSGKCENAVEQVLSRGGRAAVITCVDGLEKKFEGRAHVIKVPYCDKFLSPLVTAPVVQMLAYGTAVALGRDPDKPRHLAKSVTVE